VTWLEGTPGGLQNCLLEKLCDQLVPPKPSSQSPHTEGDTFFFFVFFFFSRNNILYLPGIPEIDNSAGVLFLIENAAFIRLGMDKITFGLTRMNWNG
jgi:hypothetical protein